MNKIKWHYSKDLKDMTVDELIEVIEDHELYSKDVEIAFEFLDILEKDSTTIATAREIARKIRTLLGLDAVEKPPKDKPNE